MCRVPVSNPTDCTASAVVQLYLRRVTTTVWPRARELRGFRWVQVPAGGTVVVELPAGPEQAAGVDDCGRPVPEAGTVRFDVQMSAAAS
ncbi:MAG TPA: fibronectin type III-like domain-contianing protein [Actinoplanes sp.]|nr:fibronectin type III-like domain-contianing protein [Actinoplanes sp.]